MCSQNKKLHNFSFIFLKLRADAKAHCWRKETLFFFMPQKKTLNLSDKSDKGSSIINCTHTRSFQFSSVQFSHSHIWLFVTPWTAAPPEFPVHHQLLELPQTHIHWVGDAIQTSHPLSSPSPPAFNPSQHQGLFSMSQFFESDGQVLELQLRHQSSQWIFRTDFL